MATMSETAGMTTASMIWFLTLRPPLPPLLLLLELSDEDVESAELREENGEEDELLETDEEVEEDDTFDLILNPGLDKTPLTKPFPVPV